MRRGSGLAQGLDAREDLVLVGTDRGVYRHSATDERYEAAAAEEFTEQPISWWN